MSDKTAAMKFFQWQQAPLSIIDLTEKFEWQPVNHQPVGELHAIFEEDQLKITIDGKTKISVDFAGGANAHRQKFGGGKGQAVAKAVGLNKGATPSVLDATAGMGKDAFVLASLGCKMTLVERQVPVYLMLEDGFRRALQSEELPWFSDRMTLVNDSSQNALQSAIDNKTEYDVVYLDPMFPHREKSAAVKKDMAIFQQFVGTDDDADELLPLAMQVATKRVVVKRPDYAPFLNGQTPSTQIKTKKNRFDVYVKAAMK